MKETAPLKKHTFHLYEGDYDRLRAAYGTVGVAAIIRRLVRTHADALDPPATAKELKKIGDIAT